MANRNPSRSLLFENIKPDEKQIDDPRLQAELQRLASRLFRREVGSEEIAPYVSAIKNRLNGKTRYADAASTCLQSLALLVGVSVSHPKPELECEDYHANSARSRISYFLTAGPADEHSVACSQRSIGCINHSQ